MGIITLAILLYKFINMLNAFFPSFGMLFATFKQSFKDISILFVIIFIISFSFLMAGLIMFAGPRSEVSSIQ